MPAKKAKVTDFGSNAVTKDGKKWNLKIVSWNVNGIRAWVKVRNVEMQDWFKHILPGSNVCCMRRVACVCVDV